MPKRLQQVMSLVLRGGLRLSVLTGITTGCDICVTWGLTSICPRKSTGYESRVTWGHTSIVRTYITIGCEPRDTRRLAFIRTHKISQQVMSQRLCRGSCWGLCQLVHSLVLYPHPGHNDEFVIDTEARMFILEPQQVTGIALLTSGV